MKQAKKAKRNSYNDSLMKIFINAGSAVFIIMLIVWVVLYFGLLYWGYDAAERTKLMVFFFAVSVLCSYMPVVIGLFKVWQQRILGSYEKLEANDYAHETVHCVQFEDVNGKKRTLRFSFPSEEKDFRRWYKKQPKK